jgi:hypothetical protein
MAWVKYYASEARKQVLGVSQSEKRGYSTLHATATTKDTKVHEGKLGSFVSFVSFVVDAFRCCQSRRGNSLVSLSDNKDGMV